MIYHIARQVFVATFTVALLGLFLMPIIKPLWAVLSVVKLMGWN